MDEDKQRWLEQSIELAEHMSMKEVQLALAIEMRKMRKLLETQK